MKRSYRETLDFLYSQLPMYQRVGAPAMKKDLGNTLALMIALDEPQRQFSSIHIAGTNGKGTVSHMIAACYQAAGFKTGLYTSPHYRDFRERIKVNGRMIQKNEVVDFVDRLEEDINEIRPSFFEMTVAMAFDHFAREEVDIAIIETGLGGRLDSTNVVTPILSVITNISYDHMAMLGDTLTLIAGEKAGIIKQGVPVVIGERGQESDLVFERVASERNSEIIYAQDSLQVSFETSFEPVQLLTLKDVTENKNVLNITVPNAGPFTALNARTAYAALEVASLTRSDLAVTHVQIEQGLADFAALTDYTGRWRIINESPRIVADSAHNVAGLAVVTKAIHEFGAPKVHLVLGFVNDKNVAEVLALFPQDAHFYLCRPDVPRGMDLETLSAFASDISLDFTIHETVQEALDKAIDNAGQKDLIFVGGSSFVVAEVV